MKAHLAEIIYSNSLTTTNDVRYLTGFVAPDPVLLIINQNRYYLIVSEMEEGRAKRETKNKVKVLTPKSLGLNEGKLNLVRIIQAVLEKINIKMLITTKDFPVGLYKEIEKKGLHIRIKESDINKKRRRKNNIEINNIKQSQQAAIKAMKAAKDVLEKSQRKNNNQLFYNKRKLTSEIVRIEIQKTLLQLGCIGLDIIVAGGNQAVDPHERGTGPLKANQAIIIDIFPKNEKTGYWGDLTRTFCKGTPPNELNKMYKTVLHAQKEALQNVKAGISCDQIHQNINKHFENSGYITERVNNKNIGFIHGTGHGVGLDIHEAPRIGKSGDVLMAGDVITIEPGLYYPGIGGIRIEDTICITSKGYDSLGECPKKFILN